MLLNCISSFTLVCSLSSLNNQWWLQMYLVLFFPSSTIIFSHPRFPLSVSFRSCNRWHKGSKQLLGTSPQKIYFLLDMWLHCWSYHNLDVNFYTHFRDNLHQYLVLILNNFQFKNNFLPKVTRKLINIGFSPCIYTLDKIVQPFQHPNCVLTFYYNLSIFHSFLK